MNERVASPLAAVLLGGLLSSALSGVDDTPLTADAKISRLRSEAERFQNRPTFAFGDLVTPREKAGMRGVGDPHIVIDVDYSTPPARARDPRDSGCDVRVISLCDDHAVAHWLESWRLETWVAPDLPSETVPIVGLS